MEGYIGYNRLFWAYTWRRVSCMEAMQGDILDRTMWYSYLIDSGYCLDCYHGEEGL